MTTFTHAGVSTLNGIVKVRFANDAIRVKVLAKNGHTDINIIELPSAMEKEDAIAHLISIDFAMVDGVMNADVEAALEEAVEARAVKPAKEPKVKAEKPAKVAKAKPTIEGIKAKVNAAKVAKDEDAVVNAALEDAPF